MRGGFIQSNNVDYINGTKATNLFCVFSQELIDGTQKHVFCKILYFPCHGTTLKME